MRHDVDVRTGVLAGKGDPFAVGENFAAFSAGMLVRRVATPPVTGTLHRSAPR